MGTFRQRIATYTFHTAVLCGLACSIITFSAHSIGATRNCTADEKATADRQLWLSNRDKQRAIEYHLPWGAPESSISVDNEQELVQRDYVIGYDTNLLVPIWTAHRLDGERLGADDRINCFRRDPRINAPRASLRSDYDEPVFDQGHLTPNGDMSTSTNAVINSFVMSNMTPQYCQFNRGVWQIFESIVRLWAHDLQSVYVITGSVFDRDADGKRDPDSVAKRMRSKNGNARVAVPTHFYKILIHQRDDGTVQSLAIMLPHDQTDLDGEEALRYFQDHILPIENIEAITGLKFFPKLAADHPAAVTKVTKDRPTTIWPYTGTPKHTLARTPSCRATLGLDQ